MSATTRERIETLRDNLARIIDAANEARDLVDEWVDGMEAGEADCTDLDIDAALDNVEGGLLDARENA